MKRFEYIGADLEPGREHDLREALRAIESTISKCEKAQLKLREGMPQHTLTIRRVKALKISVELIERELNEQNH